MIIDTGLSIAVKNYMAEYDVKRLYIFNIKQVSKNFQNVDVRFSYKKEIHLRINCPICGEYHYYEYKIKNLLRGTMGIGGCEKFGLPIVFLGNSEKVEEKVNKYKEINQKIYAML